MHESPLCAAVLDAVVHRANGRRVAEITVAVGVAHRAVDVAFQQMFDHMAEDTVADGCVVVLREIPYRFGCAACGQSGELADALPLCPACDEVVRVSGGDEIVLESLTYAGS
jgi:hydrogenase nickel incorporation protein HypA/HybF